MGQSTNGILAYGYDLGGDEEFKVQGVGEYGELKLDWYDPEAEDGDDFQAAAERRLLVASGFTETYEDGRPDYFGRESAAKEALGVEFESYCSGDYPMFVLAAKALTAYRGDCDVIDMAALSDPAVLAGYDEKLSAALAALGLTPVQEAPAWLLCSYWG
jgi:hypothetical protein